MSEVTPGGVLDGKYVLLAPIGGGRFGTVYRALHIALQKPVAVKVLHAGDQMAARDFEQFRVEAEALGRLNHPHIVGVTDFGVDPRGQGTPYLVMELVEGRTLDEVAGNEPVDLGRAAPWIAQISAALDHAHAGGVVHADLSPHNVLLVGPGDAPVVKVIDFGLARLVHLDAGPTDGERDAFALRVAGTPAYAAPERLRGEPPSSAADVYALAALTYRLVAGRPPFAGDARTVMQARLTGDPERLSAVRPGLPLALDAVLARGLSRNPSERPTASVLASEVRAAARALARARWRRREAPRRLALATIMAALLTAVGPMLAGTGPMQRLEGATLDARFGLSRPIPPDARLLLVSIDDESLDGDQTPLAGRADEFAGVLDAAVARGAAVVALDLLLPQTWAASRPFGDFVLARFSHLVLGLAADETSVIGPEAIDPLVAGALGPEITSRLFGLVTHAAAPDGVVRRARTAVPDREGRARPTLAGRVFDLARNAQTAAPSDEDFVVDYAVDATAFQRIGWRRFAESVRAGERFDGRVLLVGAEFTGSGDRHRVPGPGRLSREVSGLALQAVITDTLLQGRRLRDVPASLSSVVTGAALAGTAACLLLVRRPRRAVMGAVAAAAGGLTVAGVAFRSGHVATLAVPLVLWTVLAAAAAWGRGRLSAPPE